MTKSMRAIDIYNMVLTGAQCMDLSGVSRSLLQALERSPPYRAS